METSKLLKKFLTRQKIRKTNKDQAFQVMAYNDCVFDKPVLIDFCKN